jgi:hypothetical protein
VKTQNLDEPIRRDRRSRSTPPSAQHAEITWTDQPDPAHHEEHSPSEVLSIGETRRRPSLDRPRLRRARMAGLGLLAVAGAVLCIKAWPSSAPTALTAATPPPRPPETSAACTAHTCTQITGAPTALAQALHAALPNKQTYIALTTRDAHTGRVHRIQIDATLPGHISIRLTIDRPIQQIATPTPWSLTADGDSPWPSHADRRLVAANGCAIDIELQASTNPAAHRELPTALAEHIAEAAARAAPTITWQ